MTAETDCDPLDVLLDASAPSTPAPSAALHAEAVAMIATVSTADATTSRRRLPRVAVIGIVGGALLGVGGVAAAATTLGDWSPWAQQPDAAFTYTLPSGAVCEQRMGNVQAADQEAAQAARDWLAEVDVFALADVDGRIQMFREDPDHTRVLEDGTEVPAGYGTDEYFSPDREYDLAVNHAVAEMIVDELARQGFDVYNIDLSIEGEGICDGAQW